MPTPKPQEEKQPSLDDLKPEVLQHYPGDKITAIKLVREKTGLALKEVKDFVDKVFLEHSKIESKIERVLRQSP